MVVCNLSRADTQPMNLNPNGKLRLKRKTIFWDNKEINSKSNSEVYVFSLVLGSY